MKNNMKAIKTSCEPAGNKEEGNIVEIKTDCPECYKSIEFIRYLINEVSENNVVIVMCKHCKCLIEINELL